MLYDVPIEPLEERYTKQWHGWYADAFDAHNVPWERIHGETITDRVQHGGTFLDAIGTNVYKSSQLTALCKKAAIGLLKDGDIVFVHDLWFPGLQMLAYIRDAMQLKFKIYGCLHAGIYDPWDFLAQAKMHSWGLPFEKSILEMIDGAFLATEFHKRLILETHPGYEHKLHVTGFPIFPPKVGDYEQQQRSPNSIVFPHRIVPEKHPEKFDTLASQLGKDWSCTKSQSTRRTKKEYHELLLRSAVAVSFAEQETWGIAMQEAVFCGCIPFVPDRLSYVEMFPWPLRYTSEDDLISKIRHYNDFQQPAAKACKYLMGCGAAAINNMLSGMEWWVFK